MKKNNLLKYLFIPTLLIGIIISVLTILIITNNYQVYSATKIKINKIKYLVPIIIDQKNLIFFLVANLFGIILYTGNNYVLLNKKKKDLLLANNLVISFIVCVNFTYLLFIPIKNNNLIQYLLLIHILLLISELTYNYLDYFNVLITSKLTTQMIIENALGISLAVIFSFLADQISPRFPAIMGGTRLSITAVPILIIALRNGLISGFLTGFIYSLFNVFLDGGIYHIGSLFLDYLIPFTLLGLVGLYKHLRHRNLGIAISLIVMVAVIKYLSHSLSGVLFFKDYAPSGVNYFLYSFVYVNMPKVFLEMIMQIIIISVVYKYVIKPRASVV